MTRVRATWARWPTWWRPSPTSTRPTRATTAATTSWAWTPWATATALWPTCRVTSRPPAKSLGKAARPGRTITETSGRIQRLKHASFKIKVFWLWYRCATNGKILQVFIYSHAQNPQSFLCWVMWALPSVFCVSLDWLAVRPKWSVKRKLRALCFLHHLILFIATYYYFHVIK